MKERILIQKAKDHIKLEEFIRNHFADAKCGSVEVQYTPVVTRIIIYTTTPGLIIGSGGERIRETIDILRMQFRIDNPQIDVQKIDNPDTDPYIVAQTIATSIESGINFKRLGNYYIQRIMDAGAIGCEIVFAGKFSGQRGKVSRFTAGYIKKCGEPAKRDVIRGFATAKSKLGITGISVNIMIQQPEVILRTGKLPATKEQPPEKTVNNESDPLWL